MTEVPRCAVGHRPLEMGPDELVGVELRGVAGEAYRLQAWVSRQVVAYQDRPVRLVPVPQQNDRAANLLEELAQELNHLGRPDVLVGVEAGVEADPPAAGRDGDSREGRDLGPVSGTAQHRSLAAGRPGADHGRRQQKATLIEERQMGAMPCGVFLYGASDIASSERWPPRSAPGLGSPAFDSSSPGPGAVARGDWGGSRPRPASGSAPRPGAWSTDRWGSRTARHRAAAAGSRRASAARSTSRVGPASAWPSAPRHPACDRLPTTGTLYPRHTRSWRRRPTGSVPGSAARWPAAGAARRARGSQEVACRKPSICHLTYA